MNEHNTYPVFVADQVLTADHLNQAVNYLDEQGRLTRNRLIGIGIVCGLELKLGADRIEISKGCGVTSEGYLIQQDQKVCTYWQPYSLPEYFSPAYKSVYEKWKMWELLSAEESLLRDDPKPLKDVTAFLKDKAVVLLLEMKEKPLKNCVEIDCEDKGERVEFKVRSLLVQKDDLALFMGSQEAASEKEKVASTALDRLRDRSVGRVMEEVKKLRRRNLEVGSASARQNLHLRRFNVPARDLKNTDDVFEAFLRITSEETLKRLSEILNEFFLRYQPVLGFEYNPFEHVSDRFNDTLSYIKKENPFFIPYFYDWIDDLLKAYHELEFKIVDVVSVCCPSRDLFPLHLMLGEAPYRQEFIYSPLFNEQKALRDEVQLLFTRLVTLIEAFFVPDHRAFQSAEVRITPSHYLDKPLADRCIPFYYDPKKTYPVWNWEKARRGRAEDNLSYHAREYSSDDTVRNPLNYDIETYNFFRIEGHLGKPVRDAMQNLLSQRNEFNLPFELVALSTASISAFFDSEDHACRFQDLESIYRVLLAEMRCKLGEFQCRAGKIPYQTERTLEPITHRMRSVVLEKRPAETLGYRPGDFLRSHCDVRKGSVGEAYLDAVDRQVFFERTQVFNRTAVAGMAANVSAVNNNALYALLFYFIHAVEQLMETVYSNDLEEVDLAAFESRYRALMDAAEDLSQLGSSLEALSAGNDNFQNLMEQLRESGYLELTRRIGTLLNACIDDRMKALKTEYLRRTRELRLLNTLMHYAKRHPGMEHKAGVPKGGTFILVYYEAASRGILEPVDRPGRVIVARNPENSRISTLKTRAATVLERMRTSASESRETEKLLRDMLVEIAREPQLEREIETPEREPEPGPLTYQVPEEAIIADFYLPYVCCSDCPPISYVMPEVPKETLSIGIKPTEFCNNDDQQYAVNVSPAGGELTASGGGVSKENGFTFTPKGLKAGINTLTYTLPDGRSTHIDLKIAENFRINFKNKDLGDLTVQFFPDISDEGHAVLWDFGDGHTSGEFSPVHTYRFTGPEAKFEVTLRVTDTPCATEVKKTITVRGIMEPEFSLTPRVFCANDRNEYAFAIDPFPKNLNEVSNKDKLVINLNSAAKKLTLVPARNKIKASQDFHLEYQGVGLDVRLTVPDASFTMQLKWLDVDYGILLKPKQTDASNYTWTISQGRINHSFDSRALDIRMNELKLRHGAEIVIGLRVNHQLPSGRCIDEQRFVLTPELFKKYLASGDEFDNHTKS